MWLNGGVEGGKLVRCVVKEVQRYVVLLNGGLDIGKLVVVLRGAEVCCVAELRS